MSKLLLSILMMSCSSSFILNSNYCFNGHTKSPVGDSYSTSTFTVQQDSTFELVEKYFSSKKDIGLDKIWKEESFVGKVEINSDTIYLIGNSNFGQREWNYKFINRKNSLLLIDKNNHILQKWKKCD